MRFNIIIRVSSVAQQTHRDAANDPNPTLSSAPGVALNVPMQVRRTIVLI
jgi:hypothetical protein